LNLNGNLIENDTTIFSNLNRAFKYGDGLFETIKVVDLNIVFLEDHYFRLMASMRILRMEIPLNFSLEFFQNEIIKTVKDANLKNARVRITVFRNEGGLYLPTNNSISYLIEVDSLNIELKSKYEIDIFKDHFISSGLLATLKTTNKLINVLASIYYSENNLDNCILLNEKKNIVEAVNGNIFLVVGNLIKTPPLSEGCIKGVVRKNIIKIINSSELFNVEEVTISPFEILKADELFITNAISGIQSVTNYKKKEFSMETTNKLREKLNTLI